MPWTAAPRFAPPARACARRSRPAPCLEGGLTYRPGLDRAPAQPLRHGHSQPREGERVDPGPLGRCAEPGSRKFGSRGRSREPARRSNAFEAAIVDAAARRAGSRWSARAGATSMRCVRWSRRSRIPLSTWVPPHEGHTLRPARPARPRRGAASIGEWYGLGAPVGRRRRGRCGHVGVGLGLREKARALAGLTKGAEVYVEGRYRIRACGGMSRSQGAPLEASPNAYTVLTRPGALGRCDA
jgi:hypothetical protein